MKMIKYLSSRKHNQFNHPNQKDQKYHQMWNRLVNILNIFFSFFSFFLNFEGKKKKLILFFFEPLIRGTRNLFYISIQTFQEIDKVFIYFLFISYFFYL